MSPLFPPEAPDHLSTAEENLEDFHIVTAAIAEAESYLDGSRVYVVRRIVYITQRSSCLLHRANQEKDLVLSKQVIYLDGPHGIMY